MPRAVDIFLLAVATLIGLLTLALQAWSPKWWVAVAFAALVAAGAFGHIVWSNWRQLRRKFKFVRAQLSLPLVVGSTQVAAIVVIFVGLIGMYLRPQPADLTATVATPSLEAPPFSGPLKSEYGRFLFQCEAGAALPDAADKWLQVRKNLEKRVEIWGQIVDLDMHVSDVKGGIRIDVEAKSDDAKARWRATGMANVTKAAIELRRLDNWMVLSYFVYLPDDVKKEIWRLGKPDPNSGQMVFLRQDAERLLVLPNGACKMF